MKPSAGVIKTADMFRKHLNRLFTPKSQFIRDQMIMISNPAYPVNIIYPISDVMSLFAEGSANTSEPARQIVEVSKKRT